MIKPTMTKAKAKATSNIHTPVLVKGITTNRKPFSPTILKLLLTASLVATTMPMRITHITKMAATTTAINKGIKTSITMINTMIKVLLLLASKVSTVRAVMRKYSSQSAAPGRSLKSQQAQEQAAWTRFGGRLGDV